MTFLAQGGQISRLLRITLAFEDGINGHES